MRIPSAKTDQSIDFVAVDSTDLKTRKTGLSAFTVYRSRNGGAATVYTTPTVVELSAANMPGVYALLIDEDTTIASGSDSEEYCVHITCATMAPVTRTVELYRRDVSSGKTLTVDGNNRADASVGAMTAGVLTATAIAADAITAAKIADGAIDAATFAAGAINAAAIAADAITDAKVASDVTIASVTGSVGSVTGAVGSVAGNVTGSVGSVAAGGITSGSFAAGAIDNAAIAADAIGSSELAASAATEIGTAVWSATTRELSSGANIALAKGAGVTGFNDLDAAAVRSAVGLASANLDTQIDALPTNAELATALAGADDATLAAIAALNNMSPAQVKTQADQALTDAGVTTTVTGRIDAAISTRLAGASYTAPDNAGIGAIEAKTNNLPSDPADQSLIIAATDAIVSAIATTDGKVDGVKSVTDSLVMTAGKLWVLNDNGDPLPTADDIKASVWTALVGDYLGAGTTAETIYDTLTAAQAANAVTTKLDATLEDSSGYRFTAHALEQAPTGGSAPTASEVAIAVWDEALAGHATDGTAGKVLTDTGAAAGTIEGRIGTPAFGDLAGDIAHAQGVIDGIDAKTTNLPTDPADQSLIIAATDAVMSRLGAPAGASLSADVAAVKSDTTAVKGKTDSLAFTGGAVDANIAAVNGTEVSGTGALGDEWGPA
ncbi:hypothetical protein [Mesorhizobium sp. B1-1-7]|uniref:hypothetical protein n=1 Tax=Mesorhizobium sp. B1-1-7 TaxID=2589977 RepID=UPI0011282384|nr:hypothetical protein [Mesorhizobium sp. B1-1-7]TPN44872.1 hypothetical protein FJ978_28240 [Mesorhizobium sp. B1-1-7]